VLAAGVTLEFVEQPLPAWTSPTCELRRRWGTPIVLDESVFTIHDLRRAIDAGSGDIVNIKLAKCAGSTPDGHRARGDRGGASLMVGSMMESELGVSAPRRSRQISPDAVHDLDAAWWSLPGSDGGSPYQGGRFVLDPRRDRPMPLAASSREPVLEQSRTRAVRQSHRASVRLIEQGVRHD